MPRVAALPLGTLPRVFHAWRSVHTGPRTESFVVEGLWGMHLYRYAADVWMDGEPLRVEPGFAGFTPPGAEMRYRFQGACAHVFAHLLWPAASPLPSGGEGGSAEGCREAAPHMEGVRGPGRSAELTELPLLFPVGPRFEPLWERLEEAIPWRGIPRADVRAWDVALELADIALRPQTNAPPALTKALAFIEAHLADPISAGDVARAAFVSHNHLCRLFREGTGESVMGAIRKRRVERARHLLTHTTLPVKAVAAQVGIDDLQRFNKTVRLETGRSPRDLRSGL